MTVIHPEKGPGGGLLGQLDRFCDRLASAFLALACGVIALMALMGAVDTTLSVLASRPLPIVYEVTEVGVALLIFLAQPYIVWHSRHITVDLFRLRTPVLARIRAVVALLLAFLGYAAIAAGIWRATSKSIAVMEQSMGAIPIPVWTVKTAIFGCVCVTLFMIVSLLILQVRRDPLATAAEEGH